MTYSTVKGEGTLTVGVLLLDADSYAPGSFASPRHFAGQVKTEVIVKHVEDCTIERLIYQGDDGVRDGMVAAARDLVADGADLITGDCGFMLRHQRDVSDAVPVPVVLSGLLLIPLLLSTMRDDQKLAVITASAASLTDDLLRLSGVSDLDRVVVGDMADQPAFHAAIMSCVAPIDDDAIAAETVEVTSRLVAGGDIGAVLLECTALPPYAAAVHEAVGIPVHDVVRLVDLVAGGSNPPSVQRLH